MPVELVHCGGGIGGVDHLDALARELSRERGAGEQAFLLRARPERVVDPLSRRALARGSSNQRESS